MQTQEALAGMLPVRAEPQTDGGRWRTRISGRRQRACYNLLTLPLVHHFPMLELRDLPIGVVRSWVHVDLLSPLGACQLAGWSLPLTPPSRVATPQIDNGAPDRSQGDGSPPPPNFSHVSRRSGWRGQ
jgi:hypothetical protein